MRAASRNSPVPRKTTRPSTTTSLAAPRLRIIGAAGVGAAPSRTTRPVSASTTTVRPDRSVYASRNPSPGSQAGATAATFRRSRRSSVPSPATTRSDVPLRYAIRVSMRSPAQRGKRTFGRASDQRTSPSGSSAASSFARATTTNRPNGDHDASRQSPSRRFEPSAWTTQTPSADSTSSRPGAGSEKRAGCARSIPTASRMESSTACPGGLATAPATTATAASTTTGRHTLRSRGAGVRSS